MSVAIHGWIGVMLAGLLAWTPGAALGAPIGAPAAKAGWTVSSIELVPDPLSVLRFSLELHSSVPTRAWAVFGEDGSDETVTTSATTLSRDHSIGIWGLMAERDYIATVYVEGPDGLGGVETVEAGVVPISVGHLPPGLVQVSAASFAPHDTRYVLFDGECDGFEALIIADHQGNIVWYQPFNADIGAFDFTDEGTVLLNLDYLVLVEMELDGTVLRQWLSSEDGGPINEYIHHEVFKQDGLYYVITAESYDWDGVTYINDGVQVFDEDATLVLEWDMADTLADPTLYPTEHAYDCEFWNDLFDSAADWTHANSLHIDRDGNWLISLRHQDAVLKINNGGMDESSPDFGRLEWWLGEGGDFAWGPDTISSQWFEMQHHARTLEGGTLLMFDNANSAASARVITMNLDTSTWQTEITREQTLDLYCESRSSVYLTEHDHFLATCGPVATIREYSLEGEVIWQLSASEPTSCPDCVRPTMYRSIPLDTLYP